MHSFTRLAVVAFMGVGLSACASPTYLEQQRQAAERGDAAAQFTLAELYEKGEGVPQDYAQAAAWYEKAAEQGSSIAKYRMLYMWYILGESYYYGWGGETDYAKSAEWWRKAAEEGDEKARVDLGFHYYYGLGVERDYVRAAEWYRRAAEQGNISAQYSLGFAYHNGEGVERDSTKAAEWYRRAAEGGDAKAQVGLGLFYANGEGVEQDYAEAAEWYIKAAGQGNARAQFNLKTLSENHPRIVRRKQKEVRLKSELASSEKQNGVDDWSNVNELLDLAEFYKAQKKYDSAELFYQRTLALIDKYEDTAQANPYYITSVFGNIRAFYAGQGNARQAKIFYRRALVVHKRTVATQEEENGPNHTGLADSLRKLGLFYRKHKEYGKSEHVLLRALKIHTRVNGPNHISVVRTLDPLVDVYKKTGRDREAKALKRRADAVRAWSQ